MQLESNCAGYAVVRQTSSTLLHATCRALVHEEVVSPAPVVVAGGGQRRGSQWPVQRRTVPKHDRQHSDKALHDTTQHSMTQHNTTQHDMTQHGELSAATQPHSRKRLFCPRSAWRERELCVAPCCLAAAGT
jgi:hypothetical protein